MANQIPPDSSIVALGVTWTIRADGFVCRDDVATTGHGTDVWFLNGFIYVKTPKVSRHWYKWLGNNSWADVGSADPVSVVDPSAQIAALTAQIAQLTSDLANCRAGGASMPTISGMTVVPANLPAGGGSVVVDATVTGATAVTLDGAPVTLPVTVPVTADHTFTLVASDASAQATASVTVAPAPPAAQTVDSFTAAPNPVTAGQPVALAWSTTNATAVTLDGVAVSPSGSTVATPVADKTFTLIAYGSAAPVTRTIAVVVLAVLPPTGTLVPLLGSEMLHEQQNWMADFVDTSKLVPREVPWVMPDVVEPMNGATPARIRVWHTYGQMMGLYCKFPYFDSNGLSAPWSPQENAGDQFKSIVADLNSRALPDGPRGMNIISPYGTAIDHPYEMPDPANPTQTIPIPRAPIWLWGLHNAEVWLLYAKEAIFVGKIPGITHMHDWCPEPAHPTDPSVGNRKIMYACDLGTPNSAGVFSGGKVRHVDRATGAANSLALEDPSKYIVTDFLTGLVYPTGVCTDETGNVYTVDFGAGGKIYKNTTLWQTIPNAFMCRYDAGKVYVVTSTIKVYAIDCATGAIGPDLFGLNEASFAIGAQFVTLSIDRNGTFGRVANITVGRSHGPGNLDQWIFDGTAPAKLIYAKFGGGIGYMKAGDLKYCSEYGGHYPWGGTHHRWQARMFMSGFTSVPHELVAYATAAEGGPAEEAEPDASLNGYRCAALAMQVIRKGGSLASPRNKPSFTCLMTREGWSPFAGCSTDEIALMAFDAAEAWIRQGMIGSFRRDDLTPAEMYSLLVFCYRQSQRFLLEGGVLMAALKSWWIGKYGAVPTIPTSTTYTPEPAQALIPRLVGSTWKVMVTAGGYDYPNTTPPAGSVIVADEGTANEKTLPVTLATGPHALTVRATGWQSRAIVMKV